MLEIGRVIIASHIYGNGMCLWLTACAHPLMNVSIAISATSRLKGNQSWNAMLRRCIWRRKGIDQSGEGDFFVPTNCGEKGQVSTKKNKKNTRIQGENNESKKWKKTFNYCKHSFIVPFLVNFTVHINRIVHSTFMEIREVKSLTTM